MRQFITGGPAAFAELAQRAQRRCIVYPQQELPPGAAMPCARVGFEVDPGTGQAQLLVDRGIGYRGGNAAVARWLAEGALTFPTFAALVHWLRTDLAVLYDRPAHMRPALPQDGSVRPSVSPLPASTGGVIGATTPVYLDEEAVSARLRAEVRGQDAALGTLARAVCRQMARPMPRRPLTIFIVGPSGVGKTTTAEALAATLGQVGGTAVGYQRLDMSEYQERYRVSQLFGSPQGYVGYGDGTQLIDALSANPRTVVLFDEIEKAHPEVLRSLLNVMDTGRLSTPAGGGRTIDCRHAILVFTSNLDAERVVADLAAWGGQGDSSTVNEVCRRGLRAAGLAPELVGRIATFLVFTQLSEACRTEIAQLALERVAADYGLTLAWADPAVVRAVAAREASGDLGARPYDYLADELCGAAFAAAAQAGLREVAVLAGPPVRCICPT